MVNFTIGVFYCNLKKKKEKKQDLFYTVVRIKREHGFQGLSTDLAPGVGGGGGRGYLIDGRDAYHVTISIPLHLL